MISDPNTDPIPAPDPATPTVAAPAPMNFAAESMSLRAAVVWIARDWLAGAAAGYNIWKYFIALYMICHLNLHYTALLNGENIWLSHLYPESCWCWLLPLNDGAPWAVCGNDTGDCRHSGSCDLVQYQFLNGRRLSTSSGVQLRVKMTDFSEVL